MAVLLGVDVGGSTISAGLVTDAGEVLVTVATPSHRDGPGSAADTLTALIRETQHRADTLGLAPAAVGIGLPGIVDADSGVMTSSRNFVPELAQIPLAERLTAATGLAVFVDNDVNALTLGAWMFGPGRGTRSLALVALGTGVGGGIIVGGELLRGAHGCAGEIGHITVDPAGPVCVCGAHGCLCGFVGGQAIAMEARRRAAAASAPTLLARAGGDPGAITARTVFEAAGRGDDVAGGIVDRALDALAVGLGTILNVVDPEMLIVTGGVADSLVGLEAELRRRTARFALAAAFEGTRLVLAPVGKRETVRGGAALALYERARRGRRAAPGLDGRGYDAGVPMLDRTEGEA